MGKKRDPPFVDDVDLMLACTGLFDTGGASMYNGGLGRRRTFKQREDWDYGIPKKGETMADGEVIIPIQDWDSSIKCPKCESDGEALKMKWRDRGEVTVNDVQTSFPDGFEYLLCHCEKCGFEWLMQTSDADDRLKAIKEAQEAAAEKDDDDEAEEDDGKTKRGHGRRVVRGGA